MFTSEMIETVGLMQCHYCGAELLERDRFCRQCGIRQRMRTETPTVVASRTERVGDQIRPSLGGASRGSSFRARWLVLVGE